MSKVTLKQISKECRVSVQTVSRALKPDGDLTGTTRVSATTKDLIRKTASALGYLPDISASILRGGRSHSIGIIQPAYSIGVYSSLLNHIVSLLQNQNFECFTVVADRNQTGAELCSRLETRRVEGIVSLFSLSAGQFSGTVPVLLVGESPEGNHLCVNMKQGCLSAVEHLVKVHGHSRIGFIGSRPETNRLKKEGYCEGLKKFGLPFNDSWIISFRHNREQAAILQKIIFQEGITALLCSNDFIAGILMRLLASLGLRVPGDVAVVGFDGMTFTRFLNPSLTTVVQPTGRLASRIVEMMTTRLNGGKFPEVCETLEPWLCFGQSCGCTPVDDNYLFWDNGNSLVMEDDCPPDIPIPPVFFTGQSDS